MLSTIEIILHGGEKQAIARSSPQNNFIYSFIYFLNGKDRTHKNELALNVWLHSSVIVEHHTGIRGGHGFESRSSPAFFFAQASFSPIA